MAYRETVKTLKRKEEITSAILIAARQEVVEKGFQKVSVNDVAKRADIATGSVYRYFESKSELMAAVFRQATQKEVAMVDEAINQPGSCEERLFLAIRVFAKRALKGRRLAWALIAEPVGPKVDAERLAYRHAYAKIFQTFIEESIEKGDLPDQISSVSAAALVGTLAETLVGPLTPIASGIDSDNHVNEEELIQSISRFCIAALKGNV